MPGGSIRFSTAALRSGEYPKPSSYPAHLINRGKVEQRTTSLTQGDTNPETLTDLERAERFLYLQRIAFGGKVSGRNFGVARDRPGRFNLTTLEPMLEDLHSRLAGVVIECLDFGSFITRYDGPGTFFYLDPPYAGSEGTYGKALFAPTDFQRLADQLVTLQGRFLLSINDTPEIRATFSRFRVEEVTTSYTIGTTSDRSSNRRELLIFGELLSSTR